MLRVLFEILSAESNLGLSQVPHHLPFWKHKKVIFSLAFENFNEFDVFNCDSDGSLFGQFELSTLNFVFFELISRYDDDMLSVEGSTHHFHLLLSLPPAYLQVFYVQGQHLNSIGHTYQDRVVGALHKNDIWIQSETIDFLKYFFIAVSAFVSWVVSVQVNDVSVVNAVVGIEQIDDFGTWQ